MIVPDAEYPFYPDRNALAVFTHVRPLDAPIVLASKAVFARDANKQQRELELSWLLLDILDGARN